MDALPVAIDQRQTASPAARGRVSLPQLGTMAFFQKKAVLL